jgi:hypothetical protein
VVRLPPDGRGMLSPLQIDGPGDQKQADGQSVPEFIQPGGRAWEPAPATRAVFILGSLHSGADALFVGERHGSCAEGASGTSWPVGPTPGEGHPGMALTALLLLQ